MATKACFSLAPMLFGKKSPKPQRKKLLETNQKSDVPDNNQGKFKGIAVRSSCSVANNFVTSMELRKKVMTFRDLIDLPPCMGSASINELVIGTVNDLHKMYPNTISSNSALEMEGTSTHQTLPSFCTALKSIGDVWTNNNEWMTKCSYGSYDKMSNNDLEQLASTILDDIIKVARERLFDAMDEDEEMKNCSPQASGFESPSSESSSESYSDNKTPLCGSPATPTSVLPMMMNSSAKVGESRKSCYSSSLLPLRIQAVGKLNPIDVKRLSFHMFPHIDKISEESKFDKQGKIDSEVAGAGAFEIIKEDVSINSMTNFNEISSKEGRYWIGNSILKEAATPETLASGAMNGSLPVPSHPRLRPNAVAAEVSMPQTCPPMVVNRSASPPPLMIPNAAVLPPPPFSPVLSPNEAVSPPSPPPLSNAIALEVPLPQTPPPMVLNREASPPPLMMTNAVVLPSLPPPSPPTLSQYVAASSPSPPPLSMLSCTVASPPPTPSSLPKLPHNAVSGPLPTSPPPLMASANTTMQSPPQFSLPKTSGNMATPLPPPPPPLPPMASGNLATPLPPSPPPLPMTSDTPLPPPPPMISLKGVVPPPPPAFGGAKSLRPKKAATKLKRSSQMGNLYRLIKGKVEGSTLDGKSRQGGRKSKLGSSPSGKQGMADALAEMTKRSKHFQQIEEDARNYAKSITEVKAAITSFQTTDMAELLKFHKHVESHLEKLTDESQVLARFEDFPGKKLEALRMAAALYSKLDVMVNNLQNWKIEPPLGQLLDKLENYFSKIKGELDALERTKDEESKKLQSHKITFDFNILLRIKELTVDVSSSCMELALKERRDAKAKENAESVSKTRERKRVSAKMLWKAFQFAFRVYTFAGGHDDRADKLTRELAQEIETDPHH